jgi:hypothetical protein
MLLDEREQAQEKLNKRSSMWLRTCYTLLHIILTSLQRLFVFR